MLPTLTKCFHRLNEELFEKQLPSPDFASDPTRIGVFSYTSPTKIAFCRDFPDASLRIILDDLTHQMIHFEHHQRGIEDHTPNQYHKKDFCVRALQLGLNVMFNPSRGWAITTSGNPKGKRDHIRRATLEANRQLLSLFKDIEFKVDRDEIRDFQGQLKVEFSSRQPKQYQLKYICECPPPHNTIRSGRRPDGQRPLDATCNFCGAKFVLSDSN